MKNLILIVVTCLVAAAMANAAQWKTEACSVPTVQLVGPLCNQKPKYKTLAYKLPAWITVVPKDQPAGGELRFAIYKGGSGVAATDLNVWSGVDYFFKLDLYKDAAQIHEWTVSQFVGPYTE